MTLIMTMFTQSSQNPSIYRVSMSLSVLAIDLFIYYTAVPTGTEARTENK